MNRTLFLPGAKRWLLCLLLVVGILLSWPGGVSCAPAAEHPVLAAAPPAPLFGGLLQDVISNRTRLIQISFLFILVGIFILWKK